MRTARVERVEDRGAGLREVRFTSDDELPTYSAGQWLSFKVAEGGEDGKGIWRVYSFCSSPHEQDRTFHVLASLHSSGPGAARFGDLAPGDALLYHGPYGDFRLQSAVPRRAFFVADWVGIGPVRAMLSSLFHPGPPPFKVTLIQEAAVPHALVFRGEFEAREKAVEGFEYIPTVPGADSDWHGENRDLNELIPSLAPGDGLEGQHWYLCGSGRYVDVLGPWLRRHGIPDVALRVERFFD
ncbi:MAG: ferredoxin--NADP reductase [Acidobacteriota bacterium]